MKTYKRTSAAIACVAGIALIAAGCGNDDDDDPASNTASDGEFPDTLVLGAVPAESSTRLDASYEPLINLLEAETGSTIEFHQASDYAGVIEGMIAGNVDIAFFGPFSYVIATANGAEIVPLGAAIGTEGEPPGYQSYGIARGDNDEVDSLADYAGKDVCFVDPGSTSGFLYPSAGLIDAGVIESGQEDDVAAGVNPIFAGGHDASALAVKAGDCDAGFAFDTMVTRSLIESGDLTESDLKIVWESEMIAGSVFAGREGLGDDVVATLKDILVEKANADYMLAEGLCEGDCLITDEDAWGVAPAEDADYNGVRAVCDLTKSDKCQS